MPSTSCAPVSFFRSQVRLDAPSVNGSRVKSLAVRCASTSEKVTSSDLASLKGLSVRRTFSVPPLTVGLVGELPQPRSATSAVATQVTHTNRIAAAPPFERQEISPWLVVIAAPRHWESRRRSRSFVC